jgi:3-phosphoglycerate kinase
MFSKKTIHDIDLKGQTVLLRADYNVPLDNGKITDDYRIKQSIPTIKYLLDHADKLIICSHLGRPKGKTDSSLSLKPVAERLSKILDKKVNFVSTAVGDQAQKAVKDLASGQILLLENLRFYPQEEANNSEFAKQLASYANIFVQDGFGVVHRAHASTEAITHYLPSVAGLLLAKEVDVITSVMENPKRPLMAIIGGAKIADKIEILKRFIKIADFLAVGGALANPFLEAKGLNVADSLSDKEDVPLAKQILAEAEKESSKRPFVFAVPHDFVVANKIDKTSKTRIVDISSNSYADIIYYPGGVPKSSYTLAKDEKILDMGPFSASFIAGAIQLSNSVVWNGTLGITETEGLQGPIGPFSHGTRTIVEAIVGDLGHKPFSLVGGGDTAAYIEKEGMISSYNHVSTGGGACLDLMSGHKLPGVEALLDKK